VPVEERLFYQVAHRVVGIGGFLPGDRAASDTVVGAR
jgi:hypothetical protein